MMDIKTEDVQFVLQQVSRTLFMLGVEELELHVKQAKAAIDKWENTGWIVDPTQYRKWLNGEKEFYKSQLDIAINLLEARKAMERLESANAKLIAEQENEG